MSVDQPGQRQHERHDRQRGLEGQGAGAGEPVAVAEAHEGVDEQPAHAASRRTACQASSASSSSPSISVVTGTVRAVVMAGVYERRSGAPAAPGRGAAPAATSSGRLGGRDRTGRRAGAREEIDAPHRLAADQVRARQPLRPGSTTGHPGTSAWSEGNLVRPLIHGATYFAELHERLEAHPSRRPGAASPTGRATPTSADRRARQRGRRGPRSCRRARRRRTRPDLALAQGEAELQRRREPPARAPACRSAAPRPCSTCACARAARTTRSWS